MSLTDKDKDSNILEFLRVVFSTWWSGMSGAISIPFAFLGILNAWSQKDLFYLLAIISALFASYKIWMNERIKSAELEEHLNPHVSLEAVNQYAWESNTEDHTSTKLFYVHIKNGNIRTIHRCQINFSGYLICAPFDLRPGEEKIVPILRVKENEDGKSYPVVFPYNEKNGRWEISQDFGWLPQTGKYMLTFLADNLVPVLEEIELYYDKDWGVRETSDSH